MSREWVDDAKPKPVDKRWVMRCDVIQPNGQRCSTTSPPAAHQSELDLGRFARAGWFIAKVHGDVCPICIASGIVPRSPAYGLREGRISQDRRTDV